MDNRATPVFEALASLKDFSQYEQDALLVKVEGTLVKLATELDRAEQALHEAEREVGLGEAAGHFEDAVTDAEDTIEFWENVLDLLGGK